MIAYVAAALLAAAAPAKHAPPPAADPATAEIATLLSKEGFSPAGIKTLQARPAGLQDELAGFRARAAQIGQELAAAKAANDVERFGSAMRAGDALNAEIQRGRTEQMLRTLAALSPADRTLFLRHIGPPVTQPKPPAPPGR